LGEVKERSTIQGSCTDLFPYLNWSGFSSILLWDYCQFWTSNTACCKAECDTFLVTLCHCCFATKLWKENC